MYTEMTGGIINTQRAVLGGLLLFSTVASAAGITDYSPHSPPPVTLPPAGSSYVDPVFGTTILRVTDSSDGTLCINAYSYWPSFNASNTRLLISCDGVQRLYLFNPSTDQLTKDGTLTGTNGISIQFEGAYWSGSDPNLLYALDYSSRLWKINVASRGIIGYTLLKDFTGLLPLGRVPFQLHKSADDNIFTFHTRDLNTGEKFDAYVYDRAADHLYMLNRGTWRLDETKVDKLGRFVCVDGDALNPGFKVWDFHTGAISDFAWANPDDKPGGHIDMGAQWFVNGDGWNTGILVRSYDAMHGAANLFNIVQYKRPNGSLNWTIADHLSMRNDDETFVVGSTYAGDGTWSAFEDEIYLAYTNGAGFVRLAHSRSAQNFSDPALNYYASPRAVVDRLGRFVVYSSDLGSTNRIDVMILKVPQVLWPSPAISPTPMPTSTPTPAPATPLTPLEVSDPSSTTTQALDSEVVEATGCGHANGVNGALTLLSIVTVGFMTLRRTGKRATR